MSSIKALSVLLITVALNMFLFGCSSGTPAIPADENSNIDNFKAPVLVSEWDSSGKPRGGMGLLGAFILNIDTNELSCEISPIRSANLIDSLEVIDITNFLEIVPCRDCVRIGSIGIDSDNHLILSIGIKHPFPKGNPLEPLSGRNRIDLHVFNVEGLFALTEPSLPIKHFINLDVEIAQKGLLNASGYSTYLDEYLETIVETQANAHPYMLHFRDYTQGNFSGFSDTGFLDVYNPTGNLVMGQGCDYDYRDYIVDLDSNIRYKVLFAVECSYGVSTESFLDRFTPQYRVPQYNKKAASEVFVSVKENNLIELNTSSTAIVEVKVLDMSHGTPVGSGITQMSAASSVKKITVEVPDMMSAPVESINPTALGGFPREVSDPLRYELTITNELGLPEGTYSGLVAVEDSFAPEQNTHPSLVGQDGSYRVPPGYNPLIALFTMDKFVTYQIFEYKIQPAMQFSQRALMPTPRSYSRASVVDNLIYVIGGTLGIYTTDPRSKAIEAYDPVANTWITSLAPMPTARAGMAVVAIDKKIYVIGGQLDAGSGNTLAMEIYDTELNSWSTGTPIPEEPVRRHGLDAVVKDKIIYVAGGFNTQQKDQRTFYRYDTVNGSWGRLADMIAVRSQFAMTLKGDKIYVVGGQPLLGPGSELTPYIEYFDLASMSTWTQPNSLPKLDTPVLSPRWENVNDDIILVGGAIDADTLEHRVLLYDDAAESFAEIGQLLIPRIQFASATLNGKIYLFGGITLSSDDPPIIFLTASTEEGVR